MTSSFEEVLKKYTCKIHKMASRISRGYGGEALMDDLVEAGNVAAWRCYKRFDKQRMGELDFWMFAQTRIKGAMYDELRRLDHLGRAGRRLVKTENTEAISWAAVQRVPFDTVLNLPHGADPQLTLLKKLEAEQLQKMVKKLSPRHQQVIYMYFTEDRPQKDIAKDLNLSEGRISQLRLEAIALIREMVLSKKQ